MRLVRNKVNLINGNITVVKFQLIEFVSINGPSAMALIKNLFANESSLMNENFFKNILS